MIRRHSTIYFTPTINGWLFASVAWRADRLGSVYCRHVTEPRGANCRCSPRQCAALQRKLSYIY